MPISKNNEITVRVEYSYKQLDTDLKSNGFKETNKYKFIDIFLIPSEVNIHKECNRKILEKAILLREAIGITTNRNSKKITFKQKKINDKGEILSQYSIKCLIQSIGDAQELFTAIGYKELMKIEEIHTCYEKNGFKIIVKEIKNGSILIEAETNEKYKTIEELKKEMANIDISVDLSNFFVKKAEEELEKLKNKGEV